MIAFERKQPAVIGSQNKIVSLIRQIAFVENISQLYSLVKQYDKDFHLGKAISPEFLNTDGTPKVFYHGTTAFGFTEFKRGKPIFLTEFH